MSPMVPKPRSRGLALAVLLALALLPRLCVLLAPRADLFRQKNSPAQAEPFIAVGEEVTKGCVALEIVRGPLLPVLDYQYTTFFGGSTVVAALAAPLFAVFGPRLWALKAVPIGFHLAALVLLFLILDRFASRRAAWIGGLLMALTPPGYTIITTVAWGSHMESNALAMLACYLFLDLCAAREGKGWRRLLLGAVLGFSFWFGYQTLVFAAAIAALDVLHHRRSFLREALPQAAGFLVGMIPWLLYNLRHDFAGLSLYGASLVEHVSPDAGRAGPLHRLAMLLSTGLPASYYFEPWLGIPPLAWGRIGAITLAAGAGAAIGSLRSRPPNPGLLAIAYLSIFLVAMAISDFQIPGVDPDVRDIRYVMMMFPFLFIAFAVGADAVASRFPVTEGPVLALAAAHGLVCFLAVLPYCDRTRFWADHAATGAPDDGIGRWLALRFGDDLPRLERIVEQAGRKRTPEQQEALYASMGRCLRFMTRPGRKLTDWDRAHFEGFIRGRELLRGRVPEAYRRHFE
jgi:hypothetical protein